MKRLINSIAPVTLFNWLGRTLTGGYALRDLYFHLASFLILNLIVGTFRILRGPTRADRILASQFFTTISVAILLVLSEAMYNPSLRNVALIFVALAALTTFAFTQAYENMKGTDR